MSRPSPELDHWFQSQLLPHEPALRGWLRSQFPLVRDLDDVVQEAFVRVLRAHSVRGVASTKAFLFSTARNVILSGFRRRSTAALSPLTEAERTMLTEDVPNASEILSRRQEFELLEQAIQELPRRCRKIFKLRKVRGLSQKQIAARFGIAEHTVEAHVGQGTRRCVAFFARHEWPFSRAEFQSAALAPAVHLTPTTMNVNKCGQTRLGFAPSLQPAACACLLLFVVSLFSPMGAQEAPPGAPFCADQAHAGREPLVHQKTGLALDAYFSASKLQWLVRNEPGLRARLPMTSFAFILGVLPLATSNGAGSGSQNAIGIGVIGGLISGTVLAIFLVPVFFVVVMRLSERFARKSAPASASTSAQPTTLEGTQHA